MLDDVAVTWVGGFVQALWAGSHWAYCVRSANWPASLHLVHSVQLPLLPLLLPH